MAVKKIDAAVIADWFLANVDRQSGDSITHLKLQKLVYYAQAWHLANFNKPLFREDLQAWAHGPVAPSLWDRYKDKGWNALPSPGVRPALSAELERFLKKVLVNYGKYEAKFLEDLTHKEQPWKSVRGDLSSYARCTKPIAKEVMRDFYGEKIKKAWAGPVPTN